MEINWKHLSTTPGYVSLKAAYIHDVQSASREKARGRRPMRDKAEFLRQFNWVICRAKHYAEFTGRPIHEILNEWEAKRNYWWLSYYQNGKQPKLNNCPTVKPTGLRGEIKYYKTDRWYANDRKRGTVRIQDCIRRNALKNRTKKAKWTPARKKRGW